MQLTISGVKIISVAVDSTFISFSYGLSLPVNERIRTVKVSWKQLNMSWTTEGSVSSFIKSTALLHFKLLSETYKYTNKDHKMFRGFI